MYLLDYHPQFRCSSHKLFLLLQQLLLLTGLWTLRKPEECTAAGRRQCEGEVPWHFLGEQRLLRPWGSGASELELWALVIGTGKALPIRAAQGRCRVRGLKVSAPSAASSGGGQ